jgi:tetratricopeptide (TPR) repeat protein
MENSTDTAQNTPKNPPKSKGYDTLELVELVSVILAVGGSLATAFIQNIAVASIPISASLALGFYNRKRLVETGDQNINNKLIQLAQYSKNKLDHLTEQIDEVENISTQTNQDNRVYIDNLVKQFQELQNSTINPLVEQNNSNKEALDVVTKDVNEIKKLTLDELIETGQLIQENNSNKNQINNLSDKLQEIQQLTIAELIEQSKLHQTNLQNLSTKLQEVQQNALTELSHQNKQQQQNLQKLAGQLSQVNQVTSTLKEDTQQLHEYTKNIDSKHQELAEVVECLKEIETKNKSIKSERNMDDSYFELALNHERLGDNQGAIDDYTEAIGVNPSHAQAYYRRGALRSKMGDRQGALDDLRESAKHYFEQGDIPNYQKAKELAKEIHHIGGNPEERAPNMVVSGLFE